MDSPAVTVGERGLLLRTDELPLLSGAMHYFRAPRRSWGRCLDAFTDLGLTCVESYVPWVVHERERGRFDFGEGPRSPQGFERDLGAFLDACAERGLRVILRPGPHINAELTDFGFPARILRDPRCLAVGSRGNPVILPVPPRAFPVPSYASETFHREAATWLKGFGDFVLPWCWPDGPVVAVQLDNELSLFFRTGAYDQDYHPDAVALYRRFLARRHPKLEGTDQLEELEPPRRFDARDREGLARHLDWVAFKEWMVTRALSRLAGALRVTGLDRLVLFHNFVGQRWGAACSLAAAEQVLDLAGLDVYAARRDYAAVKRHALTLCGASRLPFAPELGCGVWPWWFPYTRDDQRHVALGLLMHGVKGFNLYMLVERDRWYGSPVGTDGQRRAEHFEEIRRLVAAVDPRPAGTDPPPGGTDPPPAGTDPTPAGTPPAGTDPPIGGTDPGLWALQRPVMVGIMVVRDYERLCLCSALTDPYPPAVLDLLGVRPEDVAPAEPTPGLQRPVPGDYARVVAAAATALDRLQVPYHHVDSELPTNRLAPYRLLVVPSFAFMDAGLLERLAGWVASGGRLLLAPEIPSLDGTLRPLGVPVPPHVLLGTEHLAQGLAAEVAALGLEPAVRASGEVDLALYSDPDLGDRPRVLFIANRTDEPQEGAVSGLSSGQRAWDALGGRPFDLTRFHLEPFEVRMLRLGDATP